MDIILCNNSSPKNKIGKAITTVDTLSGSIKEPCSLIRPEITIQRNSPTGFNYCYIPEFGRYYFVENITTIHNTILRISLVVDVLESFKNEILAQTAIIAKNTTNNELYLPDENYKTLVKTKTDIINFPNGLLNSGEFILITAGG